ncbi:MED16 [Lepeophtheirus salmonis]|uniref:MED16 n=1 Tax=Lepeophtheirus salmonis TaxID=72036 RepID=A0A7R8CXY9_LEPSM|nr:MED16 [Lepeophtheirus salmonis]CAF2965351.1 MED16 [Lepeophtheirus salmonis]
MELIYSVSSEGIIGKGTCFIHSRDEGFVLSTPEGIRKVDPNVPWESVNRKITYNVRSLAVNSDGTRVLVGDESGIELYDENDVVLGRSSKFCGETFPTSGCTFEEDAETEDVGVLVTTSGILIAVQYDSEKKTLKEYARSLDNGIRSRVEVAEMARIKDGKFVLATSDGHPEGPIKIYAVSLNDGQLSIETYVSLFPSSKGGDDHSDVLMITRLHFINPDDSDALLIAMKNSVWCRTCRNVGTQGLVCEYSQNSLVHPPSSLVASGKSSGPSYYIAIAYSDGSIQYESKMLRMSVKISDMAFTPTGNALVVVDTSGQLYLYRMSPISDPGGPHTVNYAVTMFEYCLVSGRDWWDVLICCKPSMAEAICDKLTESFQNQTQDTQRYLFGKYLAIKMSLYRLNSSTEYKAADCFANLMLTSVAGAFESILRPTELSENVSTIYKLQVILQNNQKGEWDIDKLVERLKSVHMEFTVDPHILQSFQQLIQWTSTLALHLMASVPEFKQRKGPGFDLLNDKKVLTTLRELLLLIRIWGLQRQSCLPTFTRTVDNFDVIAKVFSLITKFNENSNDESILGIMTVLLLPSQVMIPPLNSRISNRGILATARIPSFYAFEDEPDYPQESSQESLFIEGTMGTNQSIDIIRYVFLGRNPCSVKECTRCCGVTLVQSFIKNCPSRSWDKRWLRNCPCGGYWRIKERKRR